MATYAFDNVTVSYHGEVLGHADTSGPGQDFDVILMPGHTYRMMVRLLNPSREEDWSRPLRLGPVRKRKHWVMDQDWKQRLPRRRRKKR